MADYQGVAIIAEILEGRVATVTEELLGKGRELANALGQGLSAILIGKGVGEHANDLIALGADKVYLADDAALEEYQADAYLQVLLPLIQDTIKPDILLLAQTLLGRDLAPRLAFRLDSGLSPDCVDLSIDAASKLLIATRAVYGGNARAVFVNEHKPQVASIRQKTMEPAQRDGGRTGEVVQVPVSIDASKIRARFVERQRQAPEGIRLEDATIVVTGGRGIGGPENYPVIEDLADLLGGAAGATRAVVDAGWVPQARQIGLTGKTVTPNVYIAIAASGAVQHLAGMSNSKVIVVVNKDPYAPFFKVARFGVVGDYKQVIPAFREKVKELLAK